MESDLKGQNANEFNKKKSQFSATWAESLLGREETVMEFHKVTPNIIALAHKSGNILFKFTTQINLLDLY